MRPFAEIESTKSMLFGYPAAAALLIIIALALSSCSRETIPAARDTNAPAATPTEAAATNPTAAPATPAADAESKNTAMVPTPEPTQTSPPTDTVPETPPTQTKPQTTKPAEAEPDPAAEAREEKAPKPRPNRGAFETALKMAANRLKAEQTEVALKEWKMVTWSDSSLGCTRQGYAYMPVEIQGYQMVFRHDGREVRVHTDLAGRSAVIPENCLP